LLRWPGAQPDHTLDRVITARSISPEPFGSAQLTTVAPPAEITLDWRRFIAIIIAIGRSMLFWLLLLLFVRLLIEL